MQRGKLLSGPERWLCDDCIVFWCCVFVPNWFAAKLLIQALSTKSVKRTIFVFCELFQLRKKSNHCPNGCLSSFCRLWSPGRTAKTM